jgi:hypothetical protein
VVCTGGPWPSSYPTRGLAVLYELAVFLLPAKPQLHPWPLWRYFVFRISFAPQVPPVPRCTPLVVSTKLTSRLSLAPCCCPPSATSKRRLGRPCSRWGPPRAWCSGRLANSTFCSLAHKAFKAFRVRGPMQDNAPRGRAVRRVAEGPLVAKRSNRRWRMTRLVTAAPARVRKPTGALLWLSHRI